MEEYKNNLENSSEQEAKPEELASQMADTVNTIESIDEKPEDRREKENRQEIGEKERELEEKLWDELYMCDEKVRDWLEFCLKGYAAEEKETGVKSDMKDHFEQEIRDGHYRDWYCGKGERPLFGEAAKEASHDDATRFLKDKDFLRKKEKLGEKKEHLMDTIKQTISRARYATDEFKTDHPGVHYKMFTDSNCDWFEARVDQNIADGEIEFATVDEFPEKYGSNDIIINMWSLTNPKKNRYLKKFSEKYGENAENDYEYKLGEMPKESRDYLLALTKNIVEIAGNEREGWDLIEEIDDGIMADKYRWTKVEGNRIRQMTKEEYNNDHDYRQRLRDEDYKAWKNDTGALPHESVDY